MRKFALAAALILLSILTSGTSNEHVTRTPARALAEFARSPLIPISTKWGEISAARNTLPSVILRGSSSDAREDGRNSVEQHGTERIILPVHAMSFARSPNAFLRFGEGLPAPQLSSGSVCLWGRMASCARVVNPCRFAPIANQRAGYQPAPQSSIAANLDAEYGTPCGARTPACRVRTHANTTKAERSHECERGMLECVRHLNRRRPQRLSGLVVDPKLIHYPQLADFPLQVSPLFRRAPATAGTWQTTSEKTFESTNRSLRNRRDRRANSALIGAPLQHPRQDLSRSATWRANPSDRSALIRENEVRYQGCCQRL